MSRIGEMPVVIPSGVTVKAESGKVLVKGAKGELAVDVPSSITVDIADGELKVKRDSDNRLAKSFHGLVRSLIANAIEGVSNGYTRDLEIEGVGFKAAIQGKKLELSLGFASPKVFMIPDGIQISEQGGTKLTVTGIDKQQVGETAARIRSYFPAEPYKGKGLRYKGERIRRKVGKTVA